MNYKLEAIPEYQRRCWPVSLMFLNLRTSHAFERAGIFTTGQIASLTSAEILAWPQVGLVTLDDIIDQLWNVCGLRLKDGCLSRSEIARKKRWNDLIERATAEYAAKLAIPCPRCGLTNFDVYSREDVRYCLGCRENSFVVEGMAIPCQPPMSSDGGFLVPDGIARELESL